MMSRPVLRAQPLLTCHRRSLAAHHDCGDCITLLSDYARGQCGSCLVTAIESLGHLAPTKRDISYQRGEKRL